MFNLSTVTHQTKDFSRKIDFSEKLKNRHLNLYFDDKSSINDEPARAGHAYLATFKGIVGRKHNHFVFTDPAVPHPVISKYQTEQAYEGYVLTKNEDEGTFTARLVNLTSSGPDEEAEFRLSELNGDEQFVTAGAQFTWIIGLQKRGTRDQRVSEIRFRRMPSFTKEAVQAAESKAIELEHMLKEFIDPNKVYNFDL